ncbi:B9 domain-containing protein 2 [Boothiomyces sp. JEL0866]|nr:B9 domain-containing protein 2 [Boothiomyces sp. JEL0866]
MAELHVIGTISGATNYPKQDLCCKWTVITGDGWNLLEGNSSGQTHVDLPINQTTTIWDHPIAGWPKLVVNVYYQDMFGRHELYGYGFTHLPTTPGHHQIEIPTWRPCGSTSEQIWTMFLGATPQLKDLNMIYDPTDRFRLMTKSMEELERNNIVQKHDVFQLYSYSMNNATDNYLRSICDYRINYMGCDPSIVPGMLTADLVFLVLHCISVVLFAGLVVRNFRRKTKYKMKTTDKVCILSVISQIFRIATLANIRFFDQQLSSKMVQYVQTNIVLDYIYFTTGSMCAHLFLVGVVAAGAGVNLYADIKIGTKTVAPDKILNLVRLLVLLLGLSFTVGWATAGTWNGQYWYTLFRRCIYTLPICIVVFLSLPSILFFGNKVLETLQCVKSQPSASVSAATEASALDSTGISSASKDVQAIISIAEKKPENPVRQKRDSKISTFRLGINLCIACAYLLTVLNCTCLLVGYEISFIFPSIITIFKGKAGASDKLCVLALISQSFRIALLANARTASYADGSSMTDYQITKYVQTNIVLEFMFYTAGALCSNIFLVGVVSAGAGVNLFADLTIGEKVISPDKILKLLRLVVLSLSLAFCVCWCTLGTDNLENYVKFRRATYLMSIAACSCISLPVIIFFGNKVISSLMVHKNINGNTSKTSNSKKDEGSKDLIAEQSSTNAVSEAKSSLGQSGTPLKTRNKKRSAQDKIANFKWAITMTVWLLYGLQILNCICLLLGFEIQTINNSELASSILKCIGDTAVWVTMSYITIYLYRVG